MAIKNAIVLMVAILLGQATYAQGRWRFVEEATIKGSICGVIRKGYLFKVGICDFYMISEWTRQRVLTLNPSVKIFERDSDYKLGIEGFDEPVICKKVIDVIDTHMDGVFNGWDGETVWKMQNGQTWQQSSFGYLYQYEYSPHVLIFEFRGEWIMQVEGLEETIEVKKLR